jgi:hypothetical protein
MGIDAQAFYIALERDIAPQRRQSPIHYAL